jgi:spore coat protein CotF
MLRRFIDMASFIGNRVKNNTDINDQVIANSMMASAKGAANAYLNATLTCATPELRAMYGTSLNQIVGGHAAVMDLSVHKGWEDPYSVPSRQLASEYDKSKSTVVSK